MRKGKVVFHNKQFIKNFKVNISSTQMYLSLDSRVEKECSRLKREFSDEFVDWFNNSQKWSRVTIENLVR